MNDAVNSIDRSDYNLNANLNGEYTHRVKTTQQVFTDNPIEFTTQKYQCIFTNRSHFQSEQKYDSTTRNMSQTQIVHIKSNHKQYEKKFVDKDKGIFFQRENQEGNTCQICFNQLDDNRQALTNCAHADKFCKSCLYNHVANKISQFQEVTCPQQNCRHEINAQGQLFKSYPETLRIRYNKIKRFYSTIKDSTIKLCPSVDCEGILKIQKNTPLKCKICQNEFCNICFLTLHQGPCQEYQKTFLIQNLKYRQCVKCKMMIQKFKGCNQMTCLCKYQFCYICQSQWNQIHHGKHDSKGNLIIMSCCDICLLLVKIVVFLPLWILFFIVIYFPLIVLQIIAVIAISIFRGLFMQPCIMKPIIELNKYLYAIILVIFYPIFAVIGMASALRKMCEQESQTVFFLCACEKGKNNLINCLCAIFNWIFQKD